MFWLKISDQTLFYACLITIRNSAEAPRLCHLVANGDFPLREGDHIDYKDVEIGDQNEAELGSSRFGSNHSRLRSFFRTVRRILSEL